MCIFFVYVCDNPSPDGYQIIAVNNRDEFYHRPTKPAHFWNNDNCISGTDLEEGREGGTWFGASRFNRIATLLNISEPSPQLNKQGRGHLVTNYLKSIDITADTYASTVHAERNNYNAFNLVMIEKRDGHWTIRYCSNKTLPTSGPASHVLEPGSDRVLAWGNSVFDKPWQKVIAGRQQFIDIINGATVERRDQLQSRLFALLSDRTSYLPDAQLESQTPQRWMDPAVMAARSALFVDLAQQIQYGTRTQAVLLIDAAGNGEFIERTIVEPMTPLSATWSTSTHIFSLLDLPPQHSSTL